jgi:hypothetical protein
LFYILRNRQPDNYRKTAGFRQFRVNITAHVFNYFPADCKTKAGTLYVAGRIGAVENIE